MNNFTIVSFYILIVYIGSIIQNTSEATQFILLCISLLFNVCGSIINQHDRNNKGE